MGYKAYPEYRESEVTGLDRVPSHWTTWKATHGFAKIGSGTTPKSDNANYYNGDIAWVTTSELRERPIFETQINLTKQALQDYPTLKTYSPHSLIIAMYGATIGRLGILEIEATVNQACCVFSNPEQFDTKFFYYWLWMWRPTLLALSAGGGQPNLSQDTLKQIRTPAPSITEQQKISNFLDHKTARIDRLIDRKQELIGKLQEQRIAIITQAVTKGLAPEAPMQNTGISWLDAIPSNWEICPLKRIISEDTRNGLYKEKEQFIADGAPFVQMGEAFAEPELTQTAKDRVNTTQDELQKWGLLEGDLLFARRSLVFEGSGKCVIIGKLQEPHLFESSMIRVRIDTKKALPQFIFHYFQSAFSRAEILATTKTVTISGIDSQQLKGLTVCLPDIKTQGEIVDFICRSSEKFSAAITANSTTIERLQEYRAALITAAVTGQIDVRDWQAPESIEQSAQDKEVA